MAQPELVFPDMCVETAPNPVGSADFLLAGAPANSIYFEFGSQLQDGDPFPYSASDGSNFEIAVGTFRTGSPNRIERDASNVYNSSNGGSQVSFGGGGTVTIGSGIPAAFAQELMGKVQTTGFPARVGEHLWETRSMVFSPGAFTPIVSLANGNGVSGPPTWTQLFNALNTAGGTMTGLLTLGADLQTNKSTLNLKGSGGENGVVITRSDASNYTLQVLDGGSLKNVLLSEDVQGFGGYDYSATGEATYWDLDIDVSSSFTTDLTGLSNIDARSSYWRIPFGIQICWGYVTHDAHDISNSNRFVQFDYGRSFSSAPLMVLASPAQNETGSINIVDRFYIDRAQTDAVNSVKIFFNGTPNNENFRGWSYLAIGPE